ncbi:MAG TPA: hypothetical protein DIW31_02055 [Bacteroidales bacterium]|nr:hypothetical protein [Bacteroidales bacterium]
MNATVIMWILIVVFTISYTIHLNFEKESKILRLDKKLSDRVGHLKIMMDRFILESYKKSENRK